MYGVFLTPFYVTSSLTTAENSAKIDSINP